jgi:glycosyltransferase involved in cell wall biosynthesis
LKRPTAGPLDVVYVAYWSLRDPLCQSQVLTVLDRLAARGWRPGLLTFEQDRWCMPAAEAATAREGLAARGIRWVSLPYHRTRGVLSKVRDVLCGAYICAREARRGGARLIHSRGTVAGAMGYAAARSSRRLFFNDADSPLSAEYVDAGVWPAGGWLPRITQRLEEAMIRRADAVGVLTTHRRQEVAGLAGGAVDVLPCAVDTNHFRRDPARRKAVRQALGLRGTVFAYVGKAGGWYWTESMFAFLTAARQLLPEISLLVLTPDDPRVFSRQADRAGVAAVARFVDRHEMPAYLSAADVGLSFIASVPSKASSSPVKNGEYLACGLPVVTTPGIGDYSDLIARERVGLVVDCEAERDGLRTAVARLQDLMQEPELDARCRLTAEQHVSLDSIVFPRYEAIYRRLLTDPCSGAAGPVEASR